MMEYGLIGERLGHSFSPEIHGAIADYKYELCEIPRDGIDSFFRQREFRGVNVTIPYKEAVIPHLDTIDEASSEIGAVNTVVNDGGRLAGYNTDWYGMSGAILRAGIEIEGKKVLILGTGGTSKTAAYVAKRLGAREIIKVSRSGKDGGATYEEAYRLHGDAEVIINTTPCGMYPDISACPIDPSRFTALEGVFDAIFNPLRTKLVTSAKELGVKACGGLYMLVAQAVAACELFTGRDVGASVADGVFEKILRQKENIVLTGMPASGKTTVGKIIAKALGREFIDTDSEIVSEEGREIKDIFSACGEEYFRIVESKIIERIAPLQGKVIATGGGAILRAENVEYLRRNGRIYFLDRAPELLAATDDRPLSSSRELIDRRYRERINIYNSTCDVRIDSDAAPDDAARSILSDFAK